MKYFEASLNSLTSNKLEIFHRLFGIKFLCGFILLICLSIPGFGQQPLPGFTKSFNPSTIGPGSASALTFVITNSSSLPVENLAFTDNLDGMTIATPAGTSSSCDGSVSAPDGGTMISFSGGRLGGNTSCAIIVYVSSNTAGTYPNTSSDLTSNSGNSGPASATLFVDAGRPGFSKSFTPGSIKYGNKAKLTFTIDNIANGDLATNLSFTDFIPAGIAVAGPPKPKTTCSGGLITAVAGSNQLSYGPIFSGDASVAAGASCTVTVDVIGVATGNHTNVSNNLTSIPQFGGLLRQSGLAIAELEVTSNSRLLLTKSFTNDPVPPAGTVNLQFTIHNLDRTKTATDIEFTDDLDAVLSGLQATNLPAADVCGNGSSISGTSLLSFSGGTLGPEESCTFSVTLDVPDQTATGVYPNTTSSITGDLDGNPETGEPAADNLYVEPAPILTKEFLNDPVGAGSTVDLEFTIFNSSSTSTITDIAFEDEFYEGIPTASLVPANGSACGGSTVFTFIPRVSAGVNNFPARLNVSGATLGAGESCSFIITLDIAEDVPNGVHPNTTSPITGVIGSETFTGNPASDGLIVVAGPGLQKEFTDDPVVPGGTVTLEFTIGNDPLAVNDATLISFTDDLTTVLAGLEAIGLPFVDPCSGGTLTGTDTLSFTGGILSPGDSCTISVTLNVPLDAPAGTHTNTTSQITADVNNVAVVNSAAMDDLKIAALTLTKQFLNDPVLPGETVDLQFTIENVNPSDTATSIFFQDDVDDALDGLVVDPGSLPANDFCGTGSSVITLSGNTLLRFQGGTLNPGEICSFTITLNVPANAVPDVYPNLTSGFSADIDGSQVTFDNAFDELEIANPTPEPLTFTKDFSSMIVDPGDEVELTFFIENPNSFEVTNLAFTDDLGSMITGLTATDTPQNDVCGDGDLSGGAVLSLSGGNLDAGASCQFSVTLSIPTTADPGDYINTTSDLTGTINGEPINTDPASDEFTVFDIIRAIDFFKYTNGKHFDAGPGDTLLAGDPVVWTYEVTNNIATPATIVSIVDNIEGAVGGCPTTVPPFSTVSCTINGTVLNGLYENMATLTVVTSFQYTLEDQSYYFGQCPDESPTISCPGDVVVGTDDGECSAVYNFDAPVGEDSCPGATTEQTAGLASGSAFPLGSTVQTFEVSDTSGNVASCSFSVTVGDDEDPAISCPADIVVESDTDDCGTDVSYSISADDNCSGVSIDTDPSGFESGGFFFTGTTIVTATATDGSGNTAECSFSVTVEMCGSSGLSTTKEWITRVTINNEKHDTGDDGGYGDYTSYTFDDVERGSSHSIKVKPDYGKNAQTEYWQVWIDYNQNGCFLDPGELAFATSGKGQRSGNFSIPATALTGNTTMRVSMRNGEYANGPCDVFDLGEVEDYTLNIVDPSSFRGTHESGLDLSEIEILVSPNPAEEYIYLDLSDFASQDIQILFQDLSGKIVHSEGIKELRRVNHKINVNHLTPGIYHILVKSDTSFGTTRFVVME